MPNPSETENTIYTPEEEKQINTYMTLMRESWKNEEAQTGLGLIATGVGVTFGEDSVLGQESSLFREAAIRLVKSEDKSDKTIALNVLNWIIQGKKLADAMQISQKP